MKPKQSFIPSLLAKKIGRPITWTIATFILSVGTLSNAAAQDSVISLTVSDADPSHGQIIASLFDTAGSFLKTPVQELTVSVDSQGSAKIRFDRRPSGQFAIAVAYDVNVNGKLDRNFLGIPKERTGFSNAAQGSFGPPVWKDAVFEAKPGDNQIMIRLN